MRRYQQGDVNMFEAEDVPKGLKSRKPAERGFVLAEGESSGHAHTIEAEPGVDLFEGAEKTLWLSTLKPVVVRHEEHRQIRLPKGNYRIGIVREADPFMSEIRSVKD